MLDSMLIVEQLGRWKVKHPGIKPLVARAQELLAGFDRWSIRHERRENNIQADALANLARRPGGGLSSRGWIKVDP